MTTINKERVFAMYLGCECIINNRVGILKGIDINPDINTYTVKWNDGNWTVFNDFDDCKLLLTPPSDITNEDAIEVTVIEYGNRILSDYNKESIIILGKIIVSGITRNVHCNLHVGEYLRSKYYMVNYMGYDLFKEGIAINKNIKA